MSNICGVDECHNSILCEKGNKCEFHDNLDYISKCEKCNNHAFFEHNNKKVCGIHYPYYKSNTHLGRSTIPKWCKDCKKEYVSYHHHQCSKTGKNYGVMFSFGSSFI